MFSYLVNCISFFYLLITQVDKHFYYRVRISFLINLVKVEHIYSLSTYIWDFDYGVGIGYGFYFFTRDL